MRCTYCRPGLDRGVGEWAFDAGDFGFLVGHLHAVHGLRKVRITGGEPTTRGDLVEVLEAVGGATHGRSPWASGGEGGEGGGGGDLAMTTNGLTLQRDAGKLRAAGLSRVNVSLDSLDAGRFAELTGVDGLERVLAGIDAALGVGFAAVKLNTVVVAGQNEGDLSGLLRYAAGRGLPIRFIELMPMGPLAGVWAERYVPAERMRAAMGDVVERWQADAEDAASGASGGGGVTDAARMWTAYLRGGGVARVGFITPMSEHFCGTCDRLRITAAGDIYPCLMDEPRGNLAAAVRERDGGGIDAALAAAYAGKAAVHPAVGPGVMTHLGG